MVLLMLIDSQPFEVHLACCVWASMLVLQWASSPGLSLLDFQPAVQFRFFSLFALLHLPAGALAVSRIEALVRAALWRFSFIADTVCRCLRSLWH